MTAVIYARYSSDNQREESIEGQIRECTAYAEKNGGCFAISEAYDKYPLAVKLHIADLEATYLMEHRTSAVR